MGASRASVRVTVHRARLGAIGAPDLFAPDERRADSAEVVPIEPERPLERA